MQMGVSFADLAAAATGTVEEAEALRAVGTADAAAGDDLDDSMGLTPERAAKQQSNVSASSGAASGRAAVGQRDTSGAALIRRGLAPGVGRVSLRATARFTLELLKVAFALVREQLEMSAAAMCGKSSGGGGGGGGDGDSDDPADDGPAEEDDDDEIDVNSRELETVEAESSAFRQLQVLSALAGTEAGKTYMAAPAYVETMLALFKAGSPRVRRLVLGLLTCVSSRVSPEDVESVVGSVFSPAMV